MGSVDWRDIRGATAMSETTVLILSHVFIVNSMCCFQLKKKKIKRIFHKYCKAVSILREKGNYSPKEIFSLNLTIPTFILLHCFQLLWAVCASIAGLTNEIFMFSQKYSMTTVN